MKLKIENVLSSLIGFRLSQSTRVVNMECLHFSKLYIKTDKDRQSSFVGEYAIHLQCPWRITDSNKILVGDSDLYEPADEGAEYDENFDWDIIDGNLRDHKLQNLIQNTNLIVENVTADKFGGFEIYFNNQIKLSTFPTLSKKSEYSEYWRIFIPKEKSLKHFVVGSFGIEN